MKKLLFAAVAAVAGVAAISSVAQATPVSPPWTDAHRVVNRQAWLKQAKRDAAIKHENDVQLIKQFCPAREDAYWATEQIKHPTHSNAQIRREWAHDFYGAYCVSLGFKP